MGIFGFGKKKNECIISSDSPLANMTAQVIVENNCSYLYLSQTNTAGEGPAASIIASCWIKNHVNVPDTYSPDSDMKRGLQPKIPTMYCGFQEDLSPFKANQLEIVWGKEGVIAYLYDSGELICVIPYWANQDFNGYSKYSSTDRFPTIPFPLGNPESNTLFKRAEEARDFWKQDFSLLWGSYQDAYLSELEGKYGKHVKYYAIDGGNFPPKALVTFEKDDLKYAFTVGVGLFPQPNADMYFQDYQVYECIELGFCYQVNYAFDETAVLSQISSIAAIPWECNVCLGHRHTTNLQVDTMHDFAVMISDMDVRVAESQFLKERNVNLLWLMPIGKEVYKKLIAEPPDYSYVDARIAKSDIVLRGL